MSHVTTHTHTHFARSLILCLPTTWTEQTRIHLQKEPLSLLSSVRVAPKTYQQQSSSSSRPTRAIQKCSTTDPESRRFCFRWIARIPWKGSPLLGESTHIDVAHFTCHEHDDNDKIILVHSIVAQTPDIMVLSRFFSWFISTFACTPKYPTTIRAKLVGKRLWYVYMIHWACLCSLWCASTLLCVCLCMCMYMLGEQAIWI